jgi:hypothetical protein
MKHFLTPSGVVKLLLLLENPGDAAVKLPIGLNRAGAAIWSPAAGLLVPCPIMFEAIAAAMFVAIMDSMF